MGKSSHRVYEMAPVRKSAIGEFRTLPRTPCHILPCTFDFCSLRSPVMYYIGYSAFSQLQRMLFFVNNSRYSAPRAVITRESRLSTPTGNLVSYRIIDFFDHDRSPYSWLNDTNFYHAYSR